MNSTQLLGFLAPVAARCDLEVEVVEIIPAGRRRIVRIVLDGEGAEGLGPSLDEIAVATKAISAALDQSDLTGNAPYTLEVSSRGVSRPLARPQHWRRNRGRLVEVSLRSGEPVTGRIVSSTDEVATLHVDGVARDIPLAQVTKALVQVEFNRPLSADLGADEEGVHGH
jgi:ribosome maturation factor RimP